MVRIRPIARAVRESGMMTYTFVYVHHFTTHIGMFYTLNKKVEKLQNYKQSQIFGDISLIIEVLLDHLIKRKVV